MSNRNPVKSDRAYLLLAGILLTGIVVRIIKFTDSAMVMDTVAFSRLGKNLIEYGRYVFGENFNMGVFFPPGYPALIGIINLLFDDLFFSARLVSFIVSIITIVLAYLTGKELYNKQAGLFAAFVYAVYPVILIISVDAYADALFFCLLLLTIYIFIVSLKKDRLYLHIIFGISLAVTFLTRPEGLFLLLLPGLQVFGIFSGKRRFDKKCLLKTVLITTIFLLIISPYMIFLKNYTGKFSISGKANVSIILGELSGDREYHDVVNAPDNLYDRAAFTLNEDKTQLRGWNKKANLSLREYLSKDPAALIKKYHKNVMREINTLIKLLIPIMLPLLFSLLNRDLFRNRQRLIFLIYPCLFFLMYPFFLIIEKQTMVIVVFLILFSSGGFSAAGEVMSGVLDHYGVKKNRAILLIENNIQILMVAMLIISSLVYLKFSDFDNVPRPYEHIKAGTYINNKIMPAYEELNIMARKPYVNYYSNAKFTMMPYADIPDVINFAKLYGVDYIVVDERALGRWDYYDKLIEMQKYTDEVDLFYEDSSEMLIRLFKIKKQIHSRQ